MVIALITDFGTRDHFVAAMKGTILSINPSAVIVDITHEIDPQNRREAAFTLAACYRDFPTATVFVAVVDPGVGSDRRGIAVEGGGYYFVGPDNGVLSPALKHESKVVELNRPEYFSERVSNTFHGRDIFAPVAAHLARGASIESVGPRIMDFIKHSFPHPRREGGRLLGSVLRIDKFGNIITNLRPKDLGREFSIRLAGLTVTKLRCSFSEGAPGEFFAIEGSAGFIELAMNQGSAADRLKVDTGAEIEVETKPVNQ